MRRDTSVAAYSMRDGVYCIVVATTTSSNGSVRYHNSKSDLRYYNNYNRFELAQLLGRANALSHGCRQFIRPRLVSNSPTTLRLILLDEPYCAMYRYLLIMRAVGNAANIILGTEFSVCASKETARAHCARVLLLTALTINFFQHPTSSDAQQDKLKDVVVVVILLQVRHHESCSPEALSVTGKIEAYAL
jgi:hypothetical protein